MAPVDGNDLVQAKWCGPFAGEFPDGTVAQPGEDVKVPAAQAVLSGHFDTDAELVRPTALPGPEVPLTVELLDGYNRKQLLEIAASRDVTPTGTGAGGRIRNSDIIDALLGAQSAAPAGTPGDTDENAAAALQSGVDDTGDGE